MKNDDINVNEKWYHKKMMKKDNIKIKILLKRDNEKWYHKKMMKKDNIKIKILLK